MFGLFTGSKASTHTFHMVVQAEVDPRYRVRDVRGTFTSDDGSIEEVKAGILAECRKELGAGTFMVSFNYK